MCALLGITFDEKGYATAYRTTNANGSGRWNKKFIQSEGEFFEKNVKPKGSGTCIKGIHVSSMGIALTYFGFDPTAQLWKVLFHINDLLDCDGKKLRIRGGTFQKINIGIH